MRDSIPCERRRRVLLWSAVFVPMALAPTALFIWIVGSYLHGWTETLGDRSFWWGVDVVSCLQAPVCVGEELLRGCHEQQPLALAGLVFMANIGWNGFWWQGGAYLVARDRARLWPWLAIWGLFTLNCVWWLRVFPVPC